MNNDFYIIRRKLIVEMLDKYPNAPIMTISKIIYKFHSQMFLSLENVRTSVRYIKGSMGEHNREKSNYKKYYKNEHKLA